jgi:hypothetical protein
MAAFQQKSAGARRLGFANADNVMAVKEHFGQATGRLLQLLLLPQTCSDYGIANDRVDAYASTLLSLIALDPPNFQNCALLLVQQFPSQMHQPLLAAFDKLVTTNSVDLNSLSRSNNRANKLAFVRNFRAFMLEVGQLSITI